MTTPPPQSTPPLVTPTPTEAAALIAAAHDEQLRALAQQILKATSLGFDPMTLVKATVTAISTTSSPPTVSINISGDETTTIAGVRINDNYSPVVGQTVLVQKQGADIVILGHTAETSAFSVAGGSWVRADLTNGSHGGNDNGDVYYRRILDHGSWKMQWRGGWNVSGTAMIDTADALATEYRPSSKRSVLAARQVSNAVACQVDFHTDGRVVLVGGTTGTSSATVTGDVGFLDPGGFTGFTSVNHNHLDGNNFVTTTDGGSHDHSVSAAHDHGFSGGSHSHSVAAPTWVSLNGVEYFL